MEYLTDDQIENILCATSMSDVLFGIRLLLGMGYNKNMIQGLLTYHWIKGKCNTFSPHLNLNDENNILLIYSITEGKYDRWAGRHIISEDGTYKGHLK